VAEEERGIHERQRRAAGQREAGVDLVRVAVLLHQRTLEDLDGHLDAHIGQVLADHVHLVGGRRHIVFQHEGHRAGLVQEQAVTFAVALGVSFRVQHLVGLGRIVLDVGVGQLLIVLRRSVGRTVLPRRRQVIVDERDDFLAIDGVRHRLATVGVPEELAQLGILDRLVDAHHLRGVVVSNVDVVAALLLAFHEQRITAQFDVSALIVDLAVQNPQVEDIHRLKQAMRQLVAVR